MGPDVAGGLKTYLSREVTEGEMAGSFIEFEFAPVGYLTQKGEPRRADWRRYYVTEPEGERSQRVSVTSLIDLITAKAGLPFWSEAAGIKGAQEAHRQGLLTKESSLEEAVHVVRRERLGADAERDRAADRGLNIHALLEDYLNTGVAPNPSQHPEPHRGFVRALVRWLLRCDPEPVQVETLVAAPEYAGRPDLVANIGGLTAIVDAKTQANAGIYMQAHLQTALYRRAYVMCGGEPPERGLVVAFAENGEFREMELAMTEEGAMAALAWFQHARPVESLCESHNRAEKKARRAVAA